MTLRRHRRVAAGWAVLGAAALMLAAWAVLRIPAARSALLHLVVHRPGASPLTTARELLAPRCCALAGVATLALLACAAATPQSRRVLRRPLPVASALMLMVVVVQAEFAAASWMNSMWQYPRALGLAPWAAPPDALVRVASPAGMYDDAAEIRQLPPGPWAVLALPEPGRQADDRYFLHALCYPQALYPVPEAWLSPDKQQDDLKALIRRHQILGVVVREPFQPLDVLWTP